MEENNNSEKNNLYNIHVMLCGGSAGSFYVEPSEMYVSISDSDTISTLVQKIRDIYDSPLMKLTIGSPNGVPILLPEKNQENIQVDFRIDHEQKKITDKDLADVEAIQSKILSELNITSKTDIYYHLLSKNVLKYFGG